MTIFKVYLSYFMVSQFTLNFSKPVETSVVTSVFLTGWLLFIIIIGWRVLGRT